MSFFGDPLKEALELSQKYENRDERIVYFVAYVLTWAILRPLPIAILILFIWFSVLKGM